MMHAPCDTIEIRLILNDALTKTNVGDQFVHALSILKSLN